MRGVASVVRSARFLLAALACTAIPAAAQDDVAIPRDTALRLAPPGVRYSIEAADSILATAAVISLEAFRGDTVTGVFLNGEFGGDPRSVGYGADPLDRRYLWFSVGRGDTLDYVALLYDIDLDLRPEYLLFRTIDHGRRAEFVFEYRAPAAADEAIDIEIPSACQPPRCDPDTWTVHDRQRFEVPGFWFEPWRTLFALAATQGERWLGEDRGKLPTGIARDRGDSSR